MIYFIQNTKSGLVKIGFTDGDPMRRLRNLQVATTDRLRLLGAVPGDRDDERRLHHHFRPRLVSGEWFNVTEGEAKSRIRYEQDVRALERQEVLSFEGAVVERDSVQARWDIFEVVVAGGMVAEEIAIQRERRAA